MRQDALCAVGYEFARSWQESRVESNAGCCHVTQRDGVHGTVRLYWASAIGEEAVPSAGATDVLTMLSTETVAKVQSLAPVEFYLRHAPHAAAFFGALHTRRWHALMVDPTTLSTEALSCVGVQAHENGSNVLLLLPGTLLAAHRMTAVAAHTPVHILSESCESFDRLLALELNRIGTPSVRASLFSAIIPALDSLPPSICAGVAMCFGSVPVPQSISEFVRGVGYSRRSVDRWARRAGLRSIACLLCSVRLAWAWELARATPSGISKRLAVDCGYPSFRTFRIHSRRLFGIAPAALSQLAFEEDLIDRLRQSAMGPPGSPRGISCEELG